MLIFSGVLLLSAVDARLHVEPDKNGQLLQSGLISGGGFGNGLSDRRPMNPFDVPFIDIILGEPELPTHIPELPIIPDELPSRKLKES